MLAYGEGVQQVTAAHIKLAIKDTEAAYRIKSTWLVVSLLLFTSAIASVLAYSIYTGGIL
jgi:MSHA biogenesis protein MshM